MILASRYKAATLANKEMLMLYFSIGKLIADKVQQEEWGAKVLEQRSNDLQKELPGLRGFSFTNLKRMRAFCEAWETLFVFSPTLSDQLKVPETKGSKRRLKVGLPQVVISPTLSDQFKLAFLSLSFSHHSEIISKVKNTEERQFYISQSAQNFWSLGVLEHHIESNYFKKRGKLQSNFATAITNEEQRERALLAFKDEYLLDFINIESPDLIDEKEFENEIIRNIKKFILSIGTDFAFIGNQHRMVIDDDEYFVDLLFYNRKLQSLVAFDLKKGKFKPEYLGKMNFYLSALDDMVKQPHENPSIGIILCKSKTDKVVEFSFRDFNKAMGVATYKTSKELPKKYKGILPDANSLKKLLE